ncbi:hypothetical protein ACFLFF_01130 [Brevibacillus reuszeri]
MFELVENEPTISQEHAHGRLIRAGLVNSQSSELGNYTIAEAIWVD